MVDTRPATTSPLSTANTKSVARSAVSGSRFGPCVPPAADSRRAGSRQTAWYRRSAFPSAAGRSTVTTPALTRKAQHPRYPSGVGLLRLSDSAFARRSRSLDVPKGSDRPHLRRGSSGLALATAAELHHAGAGQPQEGTPRQAERADRRGHGRDRQRGSRARQWPESLSSSSAVRSRRYETGPHQACRHRDFARHPVSPDEGRHTIPSESRRLPVRQRPVTRQRT